MGAVNSALVLQLTKATETMTDTGFFRLIPVQTWQSARQKLQFSLYGQFFCALNCRHTVYRQNRLRWAWAVPPRRVESRAID